MSLHKLDLLLNVLILFFLIFESFVEGSAIARGST